MTALILPLVRPRTLRARRLAWAALLALLTGVAEAAPPIDQSQHPALRGLGRAVAERAWRPAAPEPLAPLGQRALALTVRLFDPVVVVRDDDGAFDADWADPAVLQAIILRIMQTVRRQAPTLDPHFMVVSTTFPVPEPAAFYLPLANDVRGIGYRHLEPEEVFRFTPGRLDGVLFMNAVGGWRGPNAALGDALFLQELGHRWGVYVRLPAETPDAATRLLGRDCAHWSHFVRTAGSALEGNPWAPDGEQRWQAPVPATVGYIDAERYLMGLLPPEAVPPLTVIGGPDTGWRCGDGQRSGALNPRWRSPSWRTGLPAQAQGSAEVVDFSAVVEAEGLRAPDHRAARRRWSALFVVAARGNDDLAAAAEATDALRQRWAQRFAEATATAAGDRLELDTTFAAARLINPPGSVSLGGRCLDAVDCGPEWPRCVPTGSGDRICTAGCAEPADCPADACCVRGDRADPVCVPAMGPCPPLDPPDPPDADLGYDEPIDAAPAADAAPGPGSDGSSARDAAADLARPGPASPGGCRALERGAPRGVGWVGWLGVLVVARRRRTRQRTRRRTRQRGRRRTPVEARSPRAGLG